MAAVVGAQLVLGASIMAVMISCWAGDGCFLMKLGMMRLLFFFLVCALCRNYEKMQQQK
jgi:hypothetical protein